MDKDWDKKVWDDSWERRTIQERITQSLSEDGVEKLKEVSDNRLPGKRLRNEDTQINKMSEKKRKLENEEGFIWGEKVKTMGQAKKEFLMSGEKVMMGKMTQKKLMPLTKKELMVRNLVIDIFMQSVEQARLEKEKEECSVLAELLAEASDWEYEVEREDEVEEVTDDLTEILREIDITSRKVELNKVRQKKSRKNMTKKEKLVEVAASLNKITMFFKPTPVVESVTVAMDWEEADMIMGGST